MYSVANYLSNTSTMEYRLSFDKQAQYNVPTQNNLNKLHNTYTNIHASQPGVSLGVTKPTASHNLHNAAAILHSQPLATGTPLG